MKTLIFLLVWVPFYCIGQTPESTALTQDIDSILIKTNALVRKGNFVQAEKTIDSISVIIIDRFGKESVQYGRICQKYGMLASMSRQDPKEVSKWYEESERILKKTVGIEHKYYGITLNGLAIFNAKASNYAKAIEQFAQVVEIRKKEFGKDDPSYAQAVNNLAIVYKNTYSYEKAEKLFLESLHIREIVFGKESKEYTNNLESLANLYTKIGNYKKAESFYLEIKSVREKILGKEHPLYIMALQNLSILYAEKKELEKSKALMVEALSLIEQKFGKEHPWYAEVLDNLSTIYINEGQFEKGEEIILKSLELKRATIGEDNLEYCNSLNNLAFLYYNAFRYNEAIPLYLESLACGDKIFGKGNLRNGEIFFNLSKPYWGVGNQAKAREYLIKANKLEQQVITRATKYLSEEELNTFIKKYYFEYGYLNSFAQIEENKAISIAPVCYDNILFYKGFLLQASSQLRRLANSTVKTKEKFKLLQINDQELSELYSQPLAKRKNIGELELKNDELEKELTRLVAGFGEAKRSIKWEDVQKPLSKNEAAIEFVDYQFYNPHPTDSVMFAAIILRTGTPPVFIPLIEQTLLTDLLKAAQNNKTTQLSPIYNNNELYELLWQPLEKELSEIKTIYYSPSGLLHRINLNAIPINETETLADRYQLIQLNSTRQLAIPDETISNNNKALLYGGIEFNIDTTAIASNDDILSNTVATRTRGELSFENSDSTLRGGQWNFLKWTAVEANSLQFILEQSDIEAAVNSGLSATEESFKKIGTNEPSPRILHLATHGFFFPDPTSESERGERSESVRYEPVFKVSDHPMIRSGLIMAGGNYAWKNGKPFQPHMEDGILTAYEISQMDLSNTELVVLSACETGLGDIEGNEGVYGLQRAFKIAGAKNLIMSLWQVPDFQTQELMTAFYTEWLQEKKTVAEALRSAQKQMREKYKDPFFWAGFVLVE